MTDITVKYETLKKMVKALEKINPTDDTDVSFEYIVGSCFPNVLENIKKEMYRQYTNGYIAGLREGKTNETKGTKPLS